MASSMLAMRLSVASMVLCLLLGKAVRQRLGLLTCVRDDRLSNALSTFIGSFIFKYCAPFAVTEMSSLSRQDYSCLFV